MVTVPLSGPYIFYVIKHGRGSNDYNLITDYKGGGIVNTNAYKMFSWIFLGVKIEGKLIDYFWEYFGIWLYAIGLILNLRSENKIFIA